VAFSAGGDGSVRQKQTDPSTIEAPKSPGKTPGFLLSEVRMWPNPDLSPCPLYVRSWGRSRLDMLRLRFSGCDPKRTLASAQMITQEPAIRGVRIVREPYEPPGGVVE
jgi:hypothetical protein